MLLNVPKKYLELKFKTPANNIIPSWAGILNFMFRIVFWDIILVDIGRFERLVALSEKKPPLIK